MASADTLERQVPSPVPIRPIEDILSTNSAVNALISGFMSDPGYAPFHPWPRFLRRWAEWQVANPNLTPTVTDLSQWGRTYGVPQSVFNSLGSRGGTGRNKANEMLSLQQAILNRSLALGATFSPDEITYLANVAYTLDYSTEQLLNDIVNLAKTKQLSAGSVSVTTANLRQLSKNYLVTLAPDVFEDWSLRIAKGQATEDGFQTFIVNQAKVAYPWLSSFFDQGLTTNEVFQNSRAKIAEGLELDPLSIDFSKPEFLDLAIVKDEKGNTRLANNSEITSKIRQDPRWESTGAARQLTSTLARNIAQIFGRSVF